MDIVFQRSSASCWFLNVVQMRMLYVLHSKHNGINDSLHEPRLEAACFESGTATLICARERT